MDCEAGPDSESILLFRSWQSSARTVPAKARCYKLPHVPTNLTNRLSVRPKLILSFIYKDDGNGWLMENEGLGPSRLRAFRVLIDGKEQDPKTDLWTLIINGLKLPAGPDYHYIGPQVGFTQPVGTQVIFWSPRGVGSDALMAQHARVSIQFCYCSIYDECWYGWSGVGLSVRDDACSPFAHDPLSKWWQG